MRIDDVQWALNHNTHQYEIYAYSREIGADRVITLEIAPMQLHNLGVKFMQTVERDFPPRNPPGFDDKPETEKTDTSEKP